MRELKSMCKKCAGSVKEFGRKTAAGDSHLLAVVVTMIVVVVIAAIFKTQLTSLFTNVFSQLDTTVNGLF